MTKAEIELRAHNYNQRIEALNLAISDIQSAGTHGLDKQITTLEIMKAEYQAKLDDLSVNKEYMIAFEGGGWNTVYATNDEDALAKAKEKYDGPNTQVASVTLSNASMKEAAMRNFY